MKIKCSVVVEISTARDKTKCSHKCRFASANRFDEVGWCRLFGGAIDPRTGYRNVECMQTFKEVSDDTV